MSCTQCGGTGTELHVQHDFAALCAAKPTRKPKPPEPSSASPCVLCDGTGEQKRAWAFSNGTEYMDWIGHNCECCLKRYDEEAQDWRCDLERSINEAAMMDGKVTIETYRRLGLDRDEGRCTEFVEAGG